ncbi:hypothetical protein F2Q70_00032952 [Brassica cretica]|uniref:Gnk2-homologous domain-containing protein n=1 Tax=Brassica cretica TaxID=69181 RepID=A0A8S9FII3_BRACR|nr:hypothetical protein F2Q70_00032952 [Brassica cretica]KAF2551728.1 hypothetical protein F2Q68_00037315 [Brassica cretica]
MPLLFFWSVLTCTGLVSALPCMNTSFFTPFSTYDTNRRLVLTSLASNVTAHRGFYNASVGSSPNKVYAVGMCIPGTEPEVCSSCIMSGSCALIENCRILSFVLAIKPDSLYDQILPYFFHWIPRVRAECRCVQPYGSQNECNRFFLEHGRD